MAPSTSLYTSRSPLWRGRTGLFSPGYTPLPRLRRLTELKLARVLENATDYRVAERNTVITD